MKQKIVHYTKNIFPYAILAILFILISISFYTMRQGLRENDTDIIAQDVAQLATIFNQINTDAGIISFDEQYNSINFLTIKKYGFVGSSAGPMQLAHPEQWAGPYAQKTPKMQDKPYAIVHTKKGYFITPGKGVVLHNGKIIGQDIRLEEDEDLETLALCENILCYRGAPLVAKITVTQNPLEVAEQQFVLSE